MTGRSSTERILDAYLAPESDRLPDRVIDAAISQIARTPQRRALRVPWRFPLMPALTRTTSLAAVALVAAVGIGGLVYVNSTGPGDSSSSPPVTPPPTATVPPPTSPPTAGPAPTTYVPGALTQTFTSDIHGISLNYPEGWAAQAATEPWTEGGPPLASDPTGDKVLDAALQDHLFLSVVSRPLDGASLDEWFTDFFADRSCTSRVGGTINGADRVLRGDCVSSVALASSGGRGYVFELRASDDDVELRTLDTAALLDAILATVQLLPEDAVDE